MESKRLTYLSTPCGAWLKSWDWSNNLLMLSSESSSSQLSSGVRVAGNFCACSREQPWRIWNTTKIVLWKMQLLEMHRIQGDGGPGNARGPCTILFSLFATYRACAKWHSRSGYWSNVEGITWDWHAKAGIQVWGKGGAMARVIIEIFEKEKNKYTHRSNLRQSFPLSLDIAAHRSYSSGYSSEWNKWVRNGSFQ